MSIYTAVDKFIITDLDLLKDRDYHFRKVISYKKYDTCHEDDMIRKIVDEKPWSGYLLIRYEYYINKIVHGLGKGDLSFYDLNTKQIYCVELKSLKDEYGRVTDESKVTKCREQALKYADLCESWSSNKGIPVAIIEYKDSSIITEFIEKDVHDLDDETQIDLYNWFTMPGDQTETRYKIVSNGEINVFVAERIVDYEPGPGPRRSFRKRVQKVAHILKETNSIDLKGYSVKILSKTGRIYYEDVNLRVHTSQN
jgi:hypothetical protein